MPRKEKTLWVFSATDTMLAFFLVTRRRIYGKENYRDPQPSLETLAKLTALDQILIGSYMFIRWHL